MSDPISTGDLMLVEQRVANEGPNLLVAYLLWFFLGFFSAHRFYLGRARSAVLQILSYLLLFGLFWWIVDGFALPGMVAAERQKLRVQLQLDRTMTASWTPELAPLPSPSAAPADQLAKLWSLKEAGALSDEEFAREKARILDT